MCQWRPSRSSARTLCPRTSGDSISRTIASRPFGVDRSLGEPARLRLARPRPACPERCFFRVCTRRPLRPAVVLREPRPLPPPRCFPPVPVRLAKHHLDIATQEGLTLSLCPRTLRRAARVAELVDALDSESSVRKDVLVRLQSRAPLARLRHRHTATSPHRSVEPTTERLYPSLRETPRTPSIVYFLSFVDRVSSEDGRRIRSL